MLPKVRNRQNNCVWYGAVLNSRLGANAEYDGIVREYQASKYLPFRRVVEVPTFLSALSDVNGTRVLDLACGEGFYTRLIAKRGATEVVGIDISPGMIALAQSQVCEAESLLPVCMNNSTLPGTLTAGSSRTTWVQVCGWGRVETRCSS